MKKIVLITLLLAFPLACFAQDATTQASPSYPLQLTIKSDREVYKAGEEIDIELNIKNNSKDYVKLCHPLNEGVSEIIIRNSQELTLRPEEISVRRMYRATNILIPSKESNTHIFDNLSWWGVCSGGVLQFADLKSDTYNIYVTITCPSKCGDKFVKTDWQGTFISNAITIEVVGKGSKRIPPEKYCESNEDCRFIRDYCNCKDRCVNKRLKFENCSSDYRNCKFSYDTLICYCKNNQCVEGPRE